MIIELHIPRPLALLGFIASVSGWILWLSTGTTGDTTTASIITDTSSSSSSAVSSIAPEDFFGGPEVPAKKEVHQAEEEVFFARRAYKLVEQKEELLRYQLKMVEEEQRLLNEDGDPDLERQFLTARTNLVKLLQDKKEAENHIRDALKQLWAAQVKGSEVSRTTSGPVPNLQWPVEPIYGVSAHFHEPSYEERFGFPHQGLDIPALQGTDILAPAAGTVEKVADNGYGYSYLILRHQGIATLYGHVSQFYVTEGQVVEIGDAIARTGGRPGSFGAGAHTTGPHLHFEVIKDGARIDPRPLLPSHPDVE